MIGLDKYTTEARLFPSLIILFPAAVAGIYGLLAIERTAEALAPAVLWIAISRWACDIARNAGLKAQERLKQKWGAMPAAINLRWRDRYINSHIKSSAHKTISQRWLHIQMPNSSEEEKAPAGADTIYEAAIEEMIKASKDPALFPGVFRENINYGFRRNLYGLKFHGLIVGAAASIVIYCISGLSLIEPAEKPFAALVLALTVLFSLALIIFNRASDVKLIGRRYGRELLKSI